MPQHNKRRMGLEEARGTFRVLHRSEGEVLRRRFGEGGYNHNWGEQDSLSRRPHSLQEEEGGKMEDTRWKSLFSNFSPIFSSKYISGF